MANEEHLARLKQGVKAWNQWRQEVPDERPNLSRAHLSKADLRQINFSHADLSRADLSEAWLSYAVITEANLQKVNLSGAHLAWSRLWCSNLTGANLRDADLVGADLTGTNLTGADLSKARLHKAYLTDVDLRDADLVGADLDRTQLVGTKFFRANLTGCSIYGASVWGVELEGAKQQDLIITPNTEPTVTVDNLEVAQFLYLLLNNKKIRNVIDTITTKVVLILGRFTKDRKAVLNAIREELRKKDYIPVLFDFEKPARRDLHETITTLARMSRFIIADITSPKSIPQELVSIVETLPSVPVQPLLKTKSKPWAMYDHIRRYPWVLQLHRYTDQEELLVSLAEKVIIPAEEKAKDLQPQQ
jgi:uncharacterized protein YjbI with pentapeptide repeats